MSPCPHEPDFATATFDDDHVTVQCKHRCGSEGFADVFWTWIDTRDPGDDAAATRAGR